MLTAFKLWLGKAWYGDSRWLVLFTPLSWLFSFISLRKRQRFLAAPQSSFQSDASVIIIGNITAGGTGKTPLTLGLAQTLIEHDVRLAIITRGYGGKSDQYPLEVTADTDPAICGDEALIYAGRLSCPVVVDPDRVRAVKYLQEQHQPLLILSDDGMQHYALQRDLEIAVLDGKRGLGNGRLIPRGPLREPALRLNEVDMIVLNGQQTASLPPFKVPVFNLALKTGKLHNLSSGEAISCIEFLHRYAARVHALAGIGHPERFFSTLSGNGFAIITHVFTDHHQFNERDISFADDLPVVMTEKDAVKCRHFASDKHWYLSVDAILPDGFVPLILDKLNTAREEH